MAAQPLIEALALLLQEQQALHRLAEEKTEALKKGDMKELERLLSEEDERVKALQQAEELRQKAVSQFLRQKGLADEDITLSVLIKLVSRDEGERLKELRESLIEGISALKKRNELNRQLTTQSLQFVNATLEMLAPQSKSVTYSRPDDRQEEENRRSMFDSRA